MANNKMYQGVRIEDLLGRGTIPFIQAVYNCIIGPVSRIVEDPGVTTEEDLLLPPIIYDEADVLEGGADVVSSRLYPGVYYARVSDEGDESDKITVTVNGNYRVQMKFFIVIAGGLVGAARYSWPAISRVGFPALRTEISERIAAIFDGLKKIKLDGNGVHLIVDVIFTWS